MANGPSKEDLEIYWNNSRQYFDELANHYRQTDPDYYNKYIKPYYDNPFRSAGSSSGSSKGGSKIVVFAVLMFLIIAGAAAGIFFFLSFPESSPKKIDEKISRDIDPKTTNEKETIAPEELSDETEPGELSDEDNYIIGAKYIAEKKYDKAAWHLNRIKKGSKRYKEAQQLLESIKYLKKYNK